MSLFTVQEEDFTDSLLLEECQKLSLATFGKGIFFSPVFPISVFRCEKSNENVYEKC